MSNENVYRRAISCDLMLLQEQEEEIKALREALLEMRDGTPDERLLGMVEVATSSTEYHGYVMDEARRRAGRKT